MDPLRNVYNRIESTVTLLTARLLVYDWSDAMHDEHTSLGSCRVTWGITTLLTVNGERLKRISTNISVVIGFRNDHVTAERRERWEAGVVRIAKRMIMTALSVGRVREDDECGITSGVMVGAAAVHDNPESTTTTYFRMGVQMEIDCGYAASARIRERATDDSGWLPHATRMLLDLDERARFGLGLLPSQMGIKCSLVQQTVSMEIDCNLRIGDERDAGKDVVSIRKYVGDRRDEIPECDVKLLLRVQYRHEAEAHVEGAWDDRVDDNARMGNALQWHVQKCFQTCGIRPVWRRDGSDMYDDVRRRLGSVQNAESEPTDGTTGDVIVASLVGDMSLHDC